MMLSPQVLVFLLGCALLSAASEDTQFGLPINSDGRLARHQLIYAGCSDDEVATIATDLHEVAPMHAELQAAILGGAPPTCTVVRLVKGMARDLLAYPLPEKIFRFGTPGTSLASWIDKHCAKTEIGIVNQGKDVAQLYWIGQNGQRSDTGEIGLKEVHTRWVASYLGHKFVVVNKVTGEDMLSFTVESDAFYVLGDEPAPAEVGQNFLDNLDDRVELTVLEEWNKAKRVTRTFTGLGFSKGRLPHDLWASMSAYHYNNQHRMMCEEWENKGLFVNWWEVHSHMIGMPWELKKYWQSRLKTLVEQWSGVPLGLTDIYGMREYREGARLLMHVDRVNTHAASLIINVGQRGMKEPWLLQIFDFADRLHEVEMQPGDIVYYESAKCLHARMRPLNGSAYVNLFAHYQPLEDGKGDPDWHKKPNPPGTPEPIMHFENVCTVDETGAGAFTSCGGKKASSGSDIFDFWKKTANSAATEAH